MLSNLNRTEVLILKCIVPCSQSTDKADGYDRWDTHLSVLILVVRPTETKQNCVN